MRGQGVRRRGRSSFTLLEVMLALAILMMILAVVYSSWSAILRSKKAGDRAALNAQRARIAICALEDALRGVEVFQANQAYYAFIADTATEYAYLSVASRLPASFPGSGLFGDQTLRRVTFSVEAGTNSTAELVMRQYPLLLATNAIEQAYPVVLARDVTDFALEFWDAQRGEWATEWTYTNQLPPLVRFMLGVGRRTDNSGVPMNLQISTVALAALPIPIDLQGRPAGRAPRDTNQPPAGPTNVPAPGGVIRPPRPGIGPGSR